MKIGTKVVLNTGMMGEIIGWFKEIRNLYGIKIKTKKYHIESSGDFFIKEENEFQIMQ